MTGPGEARAWGWVQHLRAGGTTPWAQWSQPGDPTAPALPGAQQLELVRRLNGTGRPGDALVGRILGTSAPGRGQPDLELVGVAVPSDFGPRPVDPADVPERELLRVASAVIAEDVVAAGLPAPPRRRRVLGALPHRQHYRLVGNPEVADPLRRQLVAQGRHPGGRDFQVYVLAGPLDDLLADLWTRCCFELGPPHWAGWLDRVVRNDDLPERIDVVRVARRWADRVGRDRVTVVLDPRAVSVGLGLRRPLAVPVAPPAAVPDLARRVAGLLGLHVTERERVRLMEQTLRPWLAEETGPPPVVPPRHQGWVAARAQEMADRIARAGYPVAGDLGDLAPGHRTGVDRTDPTATLDVAMRLMLREGAR